MLELKYGSQKLLLPSQRTKEDNNPLKMQDAFKRTFDNEAGAKVLSYLLFAGHYGEPTYTLGDPHHTAFREGQRHVVNSILAFLTRTPEELEKILKEMEKNDDTE